VDPLACPADGIHLPWLTSKLLTISYWCDSVLTVALIHASPRKSGAPPTNWRV